MKCMHLYDKYAENFVLLITKRVLVHEWCKQCEIYLEKIIFLFSLSLFQIQTYDVYNDDGDEYEKFYISVRFMQQLFLYVIQLHAYTAVYIIILFNHRLMEKIKISFYMHTRNYR
jgi:hypothetical protein